MKLELTEEWCMNAAAREGDCEIGAGAFARDPGPYDFSRFDAVMENFQIWRNADHEDVMAVHRNCIVEIIEGVKALRR